MKFSEYLLKEKFVVGDKIRQRFGTVDDPVGYINVHKNPDHSEVLEIINDFKKTNPEQYKKNGEMDFVRGFFDQEGNLFVWYGTFFHDNVEKFLRKQKGTENIKKENGFRFAWLRGDDYLTLENDRSANFFRNRDNFPNGSQKKKNELLNKLITAFPKIKTKDENGNLDIQTNTSHDAWISDRRLGQAEKSDSKSSSSKTTPLIKKSTEKKPTEELAKVGDTIVFGQKYRGGEGKVKILAIVQNKGTKQYHYIYKSRKNDTHKYPAEKILKASHLIFIDGKYNIKTINEPYSSILTTGDYIKDIIPNPDREKKSAVLYEPKHAQEPFNAYNQ